MNTASAAYMATALKERFSYITDPFSTQRFASIAHHSQVKTRFPLKENWIFLITYSPSFLVQCLACQQSDSGAALPFCPGPTVTPSVAQINDLYANVAQLVLKRSSTETTLLYVVLKKTHASNGVN